MKTIRRVGAHLVFIGLAAGVALFLRLRNQAPSFTIKNHLFRPEIGPLILATVLIFILLIGLWALISQIWTKNSRLNYKEALALDFPTYAPIAFLLLSPLALSHYLTRDDFLERLGLLAIAVGAAVLYLKIVRVAQADREGKSKWGAGLDLFLAWPIGRRIAVLAVIALILTNGGALLMTGEGISFGGDEPHYLLISHSLIKDGDLNLANNYENGDYQAYMPRVPLQEHVVPGKTPGSKYSMHSPGVSILLLPFYALGLVLGQGLLVFLVRFGMSFSRDPVLSLCPGGLGAGAIGSRTLDPGHADHPGLLLFQPHLSGNHRRRLRPVCLPPTAVRPPSQNGRPGPDRPPPCLLQLVPRPEIFFHPGAALSLCPVSDLERQRGENAGRPADRSSRPGRHPFSGVFRPPVHSIWVPKSHGGLLAGGDGRQAIRELSQGAPDRDPV
jgi:hypothetical protein